MSRARELEPDSKRQKSQTKSQTSALPRGRLPQTRQCYPLPAKAHGNQFLRGPGDPHLSQAGTVAPTLADHTPVRSYEGCGPSPDLIRMHTDLSLPKLLEPSTYPSSALKHLSRPLGNMWHPPNPGSLKQVGQRARYQKKGLSGFSGFARRRGHSPVGGVKDPAGRGSSCGEGQRGSKAETGPGRAAGRGSWGGDGALDSWQGRRAQVPLASVSPSVK